MLSKEEVKQLRQDFWNGFKPYCSKHHIFRKWVLTGVKIKSTQLKFYADKNKALVLFQIDHKNDLRRYEVYETFQCYRKLMEEICGEDLKWDEDFVGIDNRPISAIYYELRDVNIDNKEDWDKIYDFFAGKMTNLETAYWEFKDLIMGMLKQNSNA